MSPGHHPKPPTLAELRERVEQSRLDTERLRAEHLRAVAALRATVEAGRLLRSPADTPHVRPSSS